MILLADSGSTQCTWIADDGVRMRTMRTRGINAVQHSDEQIRSSLAELPRLGSVTAVRFYGAGCGRTFPETSERLRQLLARHFGTQEVSVESDLTGAARALWGRGEGIACILGTGSNSCLCRGGEIVRHVPPAGLHPRRRRERCGPGPRAAQRHLQGAHPPPGGVPRRNRALLQGDHPPRLPRTLRQPVPRLVRTVRPGTHDVSRGARDGHRGLPRIRTAEPEPVPGRDSRRLCRRGCRPFRKVAPRGA